MRSNLIAISGFLFFLITVFPSLAGEQEPISLDRLPEIITGAPDHSAEFSEERRLLLLTEPVRLQGTLLFRAPGQFEKHTLSPQREDLVVDGEWVTVSLPDQNTYVALVSPGSLSRGVIRAVVVYDDHLK